MTLMRGSFSAQASQSAGAAVRAAVVDEEYLQVRIALPHNALHTGVEIALDLIDRDNNGDGGHEGAPFVGGFVGEAAERSDGRRGSARHPRALTYMANTPSPALSAAARSFIDALPFWAASALYTRQSSRFVSANSAR